MTTNPSDIDLGEFGITKNEVDLLVTEARNSLYADSPLTEEDENNLNATMLVIMQEVIPLYNRKFKQHLANICNEIEKLKDKDLDAYYVNAGLDKSIKIIKGDKH